jgi:hypothetical protein
MADRRQGEPVDPDRRFSAVVFRTARWRASGRRSKLTTPIFASFASRIRAPSRRLSSFIGLDRPLPMRSAAAPEGCA